MKPQKAKTASQEELFPVRLDLLCDESKELVDLVHRLIGQDWKIVSNRCTPISEGPSFRFDRWPN